MFQELDKYKNSMIYKWLYLENKEMQMNAAQQELSLPESWSIQKHFPVQFRVQTQKHSLK